MAKGWQFEDNSEQVKKHLQEVARQSIEAACSVVEATAKSLAPVGNGTGELKDKIGHRVYEKNGEIIGEVGSPQMHAIWNEFGTGEFASNGAGRKGGWVYRAADGKFYFTYGMKPRPFLRPAFRQNRKNIEEIIGKQFKTTFKTKK